jgi:hypothetical protein
VRPAAHLRRVPRLGTPPHRLPTLTPPLGLIFPKRERLSAAQALRDIPAAAAAEGPALRLQSANFTPMPVEPPRGGAARSKPARGGGFFDLSQMRWRSGNSVTASAVPPAAAGTGGVGGSTNSLRWLLRGQSIPEGCGDVDADVDVEAAADGQAAAADGPAAAAGEQEEADAQLSGTESAGKGGSAANGTVTDTKK